MELHLEHCVLYCCMNTVNAGEMPMTHVTVHSRHHGWGGDSVYGGSSTASTSAHSTLHLIDHYQKMTLQPHEEGELLVYLTGLPRTDQGLLTLFPAHIEPSQSQTEPSSEEVEEATPQGSKVSNTSPFSPCSH